MKQKKNSTNRFLNYFWEPYSKSHKTLYRALHFTKLYSLILLGIELVCIVAYILINILNADFAKKFLDPIYMFIIFSGFFSIDIVFIYIRLYKITKLSHTTDVNVTKALGNDVTKAFDYGHIGLAVINETNEVIWMNSYLQSRQFKILDLNIFDCFPELMDISEGHDIEVRINNDSYSVRYIQKSRLFIFKDVTAYNEEHQNAINESLVIGTLIFDTYDEIEKSTETRKFQSILHSTNEIIDNYFIARNAIILPSSAEDTLYIMCSYENFQKMIDDKFTLLEEIHKNTSDAIIPMTISIGFAHGFNEPIPQLFERSNKAVSTALKRGGDQIVVSEGDTQRAFGGNKKIQRQQNLVRYRTYAQQLSYYIRESNRVIITGHKVSDIDSLASSVGFYNFVKTVRKNDGSIVPAFIVFDTTSSQSNTLNEYYQLRKHSLKGAFVTPNDAATMFDDKTLLIITDVHNPASVLISRNFDISEDLVKPSRIVIFDHHMKTTADTELDPLLECIDPSVSSASEMVTHLLEYTEEPVKLNAGAADCLLAGIMLDTSNFRNRVDDSTFYACNLLIGRGANSIKANNLLQEAYETYQLKCMITSNVDKPENYENFYLRNGAHVFIICAQDAKNPDAVLDKDILAKVADEHVATKDVDVCFVIGKINETEIYVSARGCGQFNVQKVCESIEGGYGGGEFDRAAISFQLKDISKEEEMPSIYDIKNRLIDKIHEIDELLVINS